MAGAQYFSGLYSQKTSVACVIDTTPPTFAGIISATPQLDGSFVVSWASATSTKTPVRYEIYVSAGSVTAAALFVTANRVAFAPSALTSWRIFVLRDQVTYFMPGAVYTFGIRAVDAQNYSDSNVVIQTSTALYPNYGTLAATVWDQLKTAHTISGSFGDNLDVKVSSRNAIAPDNASITAIKAKTDNLPADPASNTQVATRAPAATALSTAQWTNTRAADLDNLDVAVSTRLASGSYTAPDNAGIAAIKSKTDNLPSDPASNTVVNTRASQTSVNAIPTNPLLTNDARLNHLDADISSRLAAGAYTAPDNAGIAAIEAKTNNLPVDPASESNVDTKADQTTADAIKKNTDLIPAAL